MDIMNEDCTVYKTMEYISKKWTSLILLELYKGKSEKKRYWNPGNTIWEEFEDLRRITF